MIKYIGGNILNSNADIIFHQVNSQGVMGTGLGKQIREWCPQHYVDYKNMCNKALPENLLGDFVMTRYSPIKSICGIFGQLNYGRGKCQTDYKALRKAMETEKGIINNLYWQYPNCRFAVPYMFGCGSTGVACLRTNRNFIGMEQDDKYFEIACNRISDYIEQNDLEYIIDVNGN